MIFIENNGRRILIFFLFRITKKYIDDAIRKLDNEKLVGSPDRVPSVFEKLVAVDRHVAVIMALDMLIAGVDPVIYIIIMLR